MAKKYPNLSRVLKTLLFNRDMKSVDLAKEVNIPQPTVHRLVTGKSTRPYNSSLEPIANYFSITIEQLLGEVPLPNEKESPSLTTNPKAHSIPIIGWDSLDNIEKTIITSKKEIIVSNLIGINSFALIMPDSSMEPLFARNSILIFDPEAKPHDRSYVLIKLHSAESPVFRQLLVDLDHQYLKPLNPDLNAFPMRFLNNNDKVIACLIESRHNFQSDKLNKIVEEI